MLNGRLAEEDLCLRQLNQRDATATRSLLKKSMRSSLRTRKGQLKIAGSLVQVGETGDLALEMICQKICLQSKFNTAITIKRFCNNHLYNFLKVFQGLC